MCRAHYGQLILSYFRSEKTNVDRMLKSNQTKPSRPISLSKDEPGQSLNLFSHIVLTSGWTEERLVGVSSLIQRAPFHILFNQNIQKITML